MVKRNREILTGGKKYAQKAAKKHLVDEVVFDKESRKEYLTGFHKRKLQRQKKAQEYNKEQERLRKIQERKELRDERKRDLENQLQAFNKTMKDITGDLDQKEKEEEDAWDGFDREPEAEVEEDEEEDEEVEEQPLKGILHHREVYKVDNEQLNSIIDEETTVTVESLDNPIIENVKQANLQALAKINNVNLEKSEQILENSIKKAKNYAVVCGVAKPERKPKKKFRYLSKAERRENTRKEKLKGKLRGKK